MLPEGLVSASDERWAGKSGLAWTGLAVEPCCRSSAVDQSVRVGSVKPNSILVDIHAATAITIVCMHTGWI